MQSDEIVISVENLSKSFPMINRPLDLLKEIVGYDGRASQKFALKNISFEVRRGEVVGILGSNGAGKSTLLKILSGTLSKTSGQYNVKGKLSAILELGTGFHPDYSGRENILMGCMCLGMSKKQALMKLDEIIDFSELWEVIDRPFKTYSSGMQARLTFSTAISVQPDVLIIDEALAAGDSYFSLKSFEKIKKICNSGATVLFVSHGSNHVATLCKTAIWLDNGVLRKAGNALEVAREYDYETHIRASGASGKVVYSDKENHNYCPHMIPNVPVFTKDLMKIIKVEFLSPTAQATEVFYDNQDVLVRLHYKCEQSYVGSSIGVAVAIERERDLLLVANFSTCNVRDDNEIQFYNETNETTFRAFQSGIIEFYMKPLQLLEGTYLVSLGLLPNNLNEANFYEYHHRRYRLVVGRNGFSSGAIFYPNITWRHTVE